MTDDEIAMRVREAYARERLCANFAVLVTHWREWLAELDAANRVPGQENKVSGAQVLADILAAVDAKKDTEFDSEDSDA